MTRSLSSNKLVTISVLAFSIAIVACSRSSDIYSASKPQPTAKPSVSETVDSSKPVIQRTEPVSEPFVILSAINGAKVVRGTFPRIGPGYLIEKDERGLVWPRKILATGKTFSEAKEFCKSLGLFLPDQYHFLRFRDHFSSKEGSEYRPMYVYKPFFDDGSEIIPGLTQSRVWATDADGRARIFDGAHIGLDLADNKNEPDIGLMCISFYDEDMRNSDYTPKPPEEKELKDCGTNEILASQQQDPQESSSKGDRQRRIRDCSRLKGSRIRTSSRNIWLLVSRKIEPVNQTVYEVWLDHSAKRLWSDKLQNKKRLDDVWYKGCGLSPEGEKARVGIEGVDFILPSLYDYEDAEAHGIREVLPNMGHTYLARWVDRSGTTGDGGTFDGVTGQITFGVNALRSSPLTLPRDVIGNVRCVESDGIPTF